MKKMPCRILNEARRPNNLWGHMDATAFCFVCSRIAVWVFARVGVGFSGFSFLLCEMCPIFLLFLLCFLPFCLYLQYHMTLCPKFLFFIFHYEIDGQAESCYIIQVRCLYRAAVKRQHILGILFVGHGAHWV